MITAIAAIEEYINGAAQRGLSDAERMSVGHEEFHSTRRRDDGDRVGRRTSGKLIVAAPLPVLDPIGTVMKSAGTLVATVRMWLDGVAVVAAGA